MEQTDEENDFDTMSTTRTEERVEQKKGKREKRLAYDDGE